MASRCNRRRRVTVFGCRVCRRCPLHPQIARRGSNDDANPVVERPCVGICIRGRRINGVSRGACRNRRIARRAFRRRLELPRPRSLRKAIHVGSHVGCDVRCASRRTRGRAQGFPYCSRGLGEKQQRRSQRRARHGPAPGRRDRAVQCHADPGPGQGGARPDVASRRQSGSGRLENRSGTTDQADPRGAGEFQWLFAAAACAAA